MTTPVHVERRGVSSSIGGKIVRLSAAWYVDLTTSSGFQKRREASRASAAGSADESRSCARGSVALSRVGGSPDPRVGNVPYVIMSISIELSGGDDPGRRRRV